MQEAIQQALAIERATKKHAEPGAKEGVGNIKDYIGAKKIACGNCHNLFLNQAAVSDYSGGDPEIRVWVHGYGRNRHNPLGLIEHKKDTRVIDEDDVLDDDSRRGTALWSPFEASPTTDVFQKQNPRVDHDLHGQEKAEPAQGAEFIEVSCGANHSVILRKICSKLHEEPHKPTDYLQNCELWSWGLSGSGRLGRGFSSSATPTEDSDAEVYSAPAVVDFGTPISYPKGYIVVQRVACGTDHTLAICNILGSHDAVMPTHQGRVFAWGMGSYGALGLKHKKDAWTPEEVWFEPEESALDKYRSPHITVKQIACGSKHSLALTHDGRMFTWGHGGNGRLGSGVTKTRLGQSFSAEFCPCFVSALEDTKLTFIAAGEAHTGAVDQLGGLWTWGQGANGRLGHGAVVDRVTPKRVENLIGIAIKEIAFGMMHSLAVTGKGQLYGWGKGPATGLDKGDHETIQIPMLVPLQGSDREEVYQVACGPLHTMVLLKDGSMYAFGAGSEYRLPFQNAAKAPERTDQPIPKKIPDITGWVPHARPQDLLAKRSHHHQQRGGLLLPAMVGCGGSNSAAVLNNGSLWIWGEQIMTASVDAPPKEYAEEDKDDKRLAEDKNVWFPALLRKGFHSAKVRAISIGQLHILALTSDQELFAWGYGMQGQLGTGSLEEFCATPRKLNMEDVTYISAGEEHSACIIGGGESYTWGNAEGGRLGLGATMNEGLQMLPALVNTQSTSADPRVEVIPKDLRLRAVICGSAHTAFISTNDRVMTCGLGWFGRLGQGGHPAPENAYSPLFVSNRQLRAAEVHCAAYHTCIIDRERRLWVCGRDSSICKPTGQHANDPELFEAFQGEPRRYVQCLSCNDQHTLAVTSTRADAIGGNELWVWGKNHRGQLGLSDLEVPRIDQPFLLRLPDVDPKKQRVTKIATTSWHTVAVVELKKPVANKRNFEVYAWGYSGSGRLGLRRPDADELFASGMDGQEQKKTGKGVMLPGKVDTRWRPLKSSDSDLPQDNAEQDDNVVSSKFEELLQHPSQTWLQTQQLLHAEDPENKQQNLLKKAEQVGDTYTSFMEDICHLWDKSDDSEVRTEYNLRGLKREIESQYLRTLSAMNLSQSIHAPRIEDTMRTEKDISFRMHLYEELVWILQQQPTYLSNLAQHLGQGREEPQCEWFHRFCRATYREMSSSRVRNLLKALLRVMINKELDRANSIEELFSPIKSRVANLITQFTTNAHFMDSIMKPILNPDDEHSLVYLIIRYTITRDCKKPRVEISNPNTYVSGLFAANQDAYDKMDKAARAARKLEPLSAEAIAKGRQNFGDDSKDFHKLINGPEGIAVPFDTTEGAPDEYSMTEDALRHRFRGIECLDTHSWQWMRNVPRLPTDSEDVWKRRQMEEEQLRKNVMKLFHTSDKQKNVMSFDVRPVKDFIARFLREIVGKDPRNSDFQMLLVFIVERLITKGYVMQWKSSTGEGFSSEVLSPITSIVLGQMLAGVLFAVSREPHLAMYKVKINEKIRKMEKELLAGQEENEEDPGLNHRVWWNIEHLGLFFERIWHRSTVYDAQFGENAGTTQGKVEEWKVGDAALSLRRHVNKVLEECLQTNKSVAVHQEGSGYQKDSTETELTVDLYTAHYDMKPQVVTLSTVDLLLLTNYLHEYMEGDTRNQDNVTVRIDKAETDRVNQLVKLILPEDTGEALATKKQVKTINWDAGYLAVAHLTGEKHNLTMRARFMEFETGELTFCEISQAPIPRSLATANQKSRHGTGNRAVKPLRNDRGQCIDIPGIGDQVYPFEEVMLLMEALAGSAKGASEDYSVDVKYKIHGHSWSDLKNEIEEIQRKISEDMEEGRTGGGILAELLQRLENGRTFISKIRESTEPAELRSYMDQEITRRYEYNQYLQTLKKGEKVILGAQEAYKKQVEEMYTALKIINEKTSVCDIPEEIANQALAHTERLKFIDAKKAKVSQRRYHPTPAQQVYDDLLARSSERDQEKLKEMVGFPARTFTKYDLEKKGVLTKLNPKIPAGVQKNMKFTFQYENEGYTVKIFMQRTLLREFPITRRDIDEMNQARKTAVISYGEDFVWVHCFRLRRLLSEIMAQGGL